jgi:hypothetical protein
VDEDESESNGLDSAAIDGESAAAAVAALQAELQLADGNLDALDRKASLLPAFLAGLAGLFISADTSVNGAAVVAVVTALGTGILAVASALLALRARAHVLGPNAEEVVRNLDVPIAVFNAALANSLATAVNDATRVALFKSTWLNRAMLLAVATILLLSLGRITGAGA